MTIVWRRSSRCDSGACVEVVRDGERVLVRQSEGPSDGSIEYTLAHWGVKISAMRSAYAEGERSHWLPSNVSWRADGVAWHANQVTLRFTHAEWHTFVDQVLAGGFDVERLVEVSRG